MGAVEDVKDETNIGKLERTDVLADIVRAPMARPDDGDLAAFHRSRVVNERP